MLVTSQAIKLMRPGSVLVDMAASELGGNIEGSKPDETVVTDGGVTIIGAGNLAATVPAAASAAYARNMTSLLQHIIKDGELAIDTTDAIQAGVVITHDGQVVHPAVAELLGSAPPSGAGSAGDPAAGSGGPADGTAADPADGEGASGR
jgi:NAD(P) transhydrogenase subunit alpha